MNFVTKIFIPVVLLLAFPFFTLKAQVSFTNANAKLSETNIHSGCPTGIADINGDGLDDIVRLDQAHLLYIDYQRPGLTFDHHLIGDFGGGNGWAWGLCIADADHNGFKDVVAGGYGPAVKLMKLNDNGTSGVSYSLPSSNFFLQNVNFADVNNDGWEDIFGCDDNAENHIWLNNGNGNFTVSSIIDFDVTNTDDSGNYGSVWTDFDNDGDIDLYIAKCRQAINNPSDGRRIDVLFVNDGNNNYTSDAATYGLADSAQTWTANFADIDNDGDLDVIQTDYDVPANLLENDGTGHMTNITAGSGFVMNIIPIESVMEDFDNDGFVDILVTGSNYQFFHNNGNKTFTYLPGVFGNGSMESFAIGDLNHDGKIDVYASYAGIYTSPSSVDDVYWLNTTDNNNHFVSIQLEGTGSNAGALGARATIFGTWGKQVREVHAGESYGTCNTSILHFGLGSANAIDSIRINWPAGGVTTLINPATDQFIHVIEDECVSPDLTVSNSGGTILCAGQSLTLTASDVPPGFSYLWSTGAVTKSIEVTETGDYNVKISSEDNACFTTSKTSTIIQNPVEIPAVTVSGALTFCEGQSVTLTAPAAASYAWSNGGNTQSINVTEPGSYTVTVPGTCDLITSEPIDVNVWMVPAPMASDVYLTEPGTTTLTATGEDVTWYDAASGGNLLASGNTFNTPYITDSATYYAQSAAAFGADTLYVGQQDHLGSTYSGSNSTNSSIIFNVAEACVLKSVKVYTDTPGDRLIEWVNHNGSVVQSALVNIPINTNRIDLNFNLVPGNDYELTTNIAQNNLSFGYDGPRLQRSNQGVTYPYAIDNLVSLTGSPFGSDYYYYFYDWEVQKIPTYCNSSRTAVSVYVQDINGLSSPANTAQWNVYPNPAATVLFISSRSFVAGNTLVQLLDVTGRVLQTIPATNLQAGASLALDVSGFAKGIYLLRIAQGGVLQQQMVVVE